jgi:transglutaminase-like putative cysteine protease
MNNIWARNYWWTRIEQRIKNFSKIKTEESILFRCSVQLLVSIGIVSADIAAGTSSSFWAIPLSTFGSILSWHQRKKFNLTTKLLLAVGMIVALIIFLNNLLGSLNDSRLVLEQLLIQLQVLHSFDLPRRKDLGYSMIIGLILLAVAGTLSQSMFFAPCLVIFLIVGMPVMILDYRSSLGLARLDDLLIQSQNRGQKITNIFSISFITKYFLLVLGLGLLLFSLMPRFSSYQFQSFPMYSPDSFENMNFKGKNSTVLNPGYAKQNKEINASNNKSQGQGSGIMDNTFYYGFNTKINQNLRGTLKEEIVMKVRSQAVGFWRVMAFNSYTGQGWENSRQKNLTTFTRDPWNFRFYLPPTPTIANTKEIVQSYSIVSTLPNVLPALSSPISVFFPTQQLNLDTENTINSPNLLVDGLTYTVISQVSYRNQSLLDKASNNYSPSIKNNYLLVPTSIKDRIKDKTLELLSNSPKPLVNSYQKSLYLAQALKQQYKLLPDLPFFTKKEDLVESFLFKYHGGYPDHFSTVLTIMLRSIGIPTRLAVGFTPGSFNPFTGYYVVKNTDAYALTEVYFPKYGWYPFDPLPGHPLFPPSLEDEESFGILKYFWNWLIGFLPSPVTSFFSVLCNGIINFVIHFLSTIWAFISKGILGLFVGLLALVSMFFFCWLSFAEYKKIKQKFKFKKLEVTERIYQQMLMLLSFQGHPKKTFQTPLEYAKDCSDFYGYPIGQMIEEISISYVSWRYGGNTQNVDYLNKQLKTIQNSLSGLRSFKRGNRD